MVSKKSAATIAIVMYALAAKVHAGQVDQMLNFQARLTNDQGAALVGSHTIDFFIYGQETGGAIIGSILNAAVNIPAGANGVVSLPIGPVQEAWFNDAPRFMGLTIDDNDDNPLGNELAPRLRMTVVPFALRALNVPTSAAIDVQSANIAGPLTISGNLGIGSPNPTYNLEVLRPDGQPSIVLGRTQDPGTGTAGYFRMTGEDGFLQFMTSQDKQSWAEVMRMTKDQEVEIIRLDATAKLIMGRSQDSTAGYVRMLAEDGWLSFQTSQDKTSWNDVLKVENDGRTATVDVLRITGGSDLAEPFDVVADGTLSAIPGMVMVIDSVHIGQLAISSNAYDRKVAGILSGANGLEPGMVMRADDQPLAHGDHNLALTGRVWCWCDASDVTGGGPIEPGDLLTTSSTPGHAMKAIDHARASGATVGKAMSRLASGRGMVLVLVNLQ